MLRYFKEETENGKLFVSYPMIESIKYTKELPDNQYHTYTILRDDCLNGKFKKNVKKFCFYNGYTYLKDKNNWDHIIQQNVFKANMLTTDKLSWPVSKEDIEQQFVFEAQTKKHVIPNKEVAILNAFPLFLYDYFPKEKFQR